MIFLKFNVLTIGPQALLKFTSSVYFAYVITTLNCCYFSYLVSAKLGS